MAKADMSKATIEILYEGETVLGSQTNGEYMVVEYDEDGDESGGSFYKTIEEAKGHEGTDCCIAEMPINSYMIYKNTIYKIIK